MPDNAPSAADISRARMAVDAYLEYVNDRKLGRPAGVPFGTLEELEAAVQAATRPSDRLIAITRRQALADFQARQESQGDLEDGFVKWSPVFAERYGITYPAWREMRVPVSVLQRAGLAPKPVKPSNGRGMGAPGHMRGMRNGKLTLRQQVLIALNEHSATNHEVEVALHLGHGRVSPTIAALRKSGLIEAQGSMGEYVYAITDKGRAQLESTIGE